MGHCSDCIPAGQRKETILEVLMCVHLEETKNLLEICGKTKMYQVSSNEN